MIKLQEGLDLSGYTLILPSVAVGNVAQLSVDLLISSLNLKKCGRIFDSAFIPIVGADPYNEDNQEICTSLDLYMSREKKIVVLQIRSPLIKKPTNFLYQIQNFITDSKISKVNTNFAM